MLPAHLPRWLALAVGLLLAAQSQAATVLRVGERDHYSLNASVQVLEDAQQTLHLEDVASGKAAGSFAAPKGGKFSFGFTRSAYWFRIVLDNPRTEPLRRLLVIRTPWLDTIEFYSPDGHGAFSRQLRGDSLPFAQRSYLAPPFVMPVSIAPGPHAYYLRVTCTKAFLVPIDLWKPSAFYPHGRSLMLYYGLIYGVLLSAAIYNLFLWRSTRDNSYPLYSLYMVSFALMNFVYNGFAYQYLWPETPEWSNFAFAQTFFILQIVGLLFTQTFLDLKRSLPWAHRLLRGWLAVLVLAWIAIATMVDRSSIYYDMVPLCTLSITPLLMTCAGIAAWSRGYRAARFFVIASTASVVGMVAAVLTVLGAMPYSFASFHAPEFGFVMDSVLFSLALADRVNVMRIQRKQAEDLARIDTLTGIANRRHFNENSQNQLLRARRANHTFSVVMFDIDLFKRVNDSYGHSAGDAVIVAVAGVAKRTARQTDFVARIGGEEFAILLIGANAMSAAQFANSLRQNIGANVVTHEGQAIRCTVSLGVSELAPSDKNFDSMLSRADQALYQAKQTGRNRVVVHELHGEPDITGKSA